jgi:hypothetical protein
MKAEGGNDELKTRASVSRLSSFIVAAFILAFVCPRFLLFQCKSELLANSTIIQRSVNIR